MGGHKAGKLQVSLLLMNFKKRFEDENFIEYEQAETWLRFNLKRD